MKVMTVRGPIDADLMGITLAHEHVFIDLRNQFTEFEDPEQRRLSHQPLRMDNLGVVRRDPYAIKDNLLIDDLDVAIHELEYFKVLGGKSIVDCTSIGIHRDVKKLQQVAIATDLNIVAGCGYYTYDTHPPQMEDWSAEDIAQEMVDELTVGIDGTGIKAGLIGEIGTSSPIHPHERKNLLAAAMAYHHTGAAIQVHTYPWGEEGNAVVDVLLDKDVAPEKIAICHIDVSINLDYIRSLLKRGVFVEFDNCGKEFTPTANKQRFAGGAFARDMDRIHTIKTLLDEGYDKQILITNDVCLKCMLRHYGGWGYDHVLKNFVPLMLSAGIDQSVIDVLLQDNPKRLYAVNIP